jgi:hypothetical protein
MHGHGLRWLVIHLRSLLVGSLHCLLLQRLNVSVGELRRVNLL